MRLNELSTPAVVGLTGGALLIVSAVIIFTPPLPQDASYHNFADQRALFGTPHALNVISNVFLCLFAIWGAVSYTHLTLPTKA